MNDEWMRRKVIAIWITLMIVSFFGAWIWERIRR